jgi:hypothetical protein
MEISVCGKESWEIFAGSVDGFRVKHPRDGTNKCCFDRKARGVFLPLSLKLGESRRQLTSTVKKVGPLT